jgi:aromatic ring-cleaving dioxygenase
LPNPESPTNTLTEWLGDQAGHQIRSVRLCANGASQVGWKKQAVFLLHFEEDRDGGVVLRRVRGLGKGMEALAIEPPWEI